MAAKNLITETCVRAMDPGTIVRLEPGTIITPAARDLAFSRGINLEEGRAGSAECVAGGGKGEECMWHRVLATEGEFLVQVRAGRAVITRLSPDGPVAFGTDLLERHA